MKYLHKLLFLIVLITGAYAQAQCEYTDALCAQDVHPDYELYYLDSDGDGYGNPNLCYCKDPNGDLTNYVKNKKDCDDNDPEFPKWFYVDMDGDGKGAADGFTAFACAPPNNNWAENNDDCDDADPQVWQAIPYHPDEDGDGFATPSLNPLFLCGEEVPDGYSNVLGDCDDSDPSIYPGAPEPCGQEKNCDGEVTQEPDPPVVHNHLICGPGEVEITPLYLSDDNAFPDFYRLYSSNMDFITEIAFGESHVTQANVSTNYHVSAVWNDCEGNITQVQIIVEELDTFFVDADGDGYAVLGEEVSDCENPDEDIYVTEEQLLSTEVTDCDDTNPNVNIVKWWYSDFDGDGFGDSSDMVESCEQPEGYVDNNNDACPFEHGTDNGCGYQSPTFSDENYVYTRTYQRAKTAPEDIDQESDVLESVVYYDGLGRPMQQLSPKASPTGKDIATHIGYDPFGRQDKEWLPYETTTETPGIYGQNAATETEAYYLQHYAEDLGNSPNPFSQKEFEPSPLNRVLKQAAPGEAWQLGSGHEIEFDYQANNESDGVRLWEVGTQLENNTFVPYLLEQQGAVTYAPGELYKTITYDENHDGSDTKLHTTEEFTDKLGKVVLKRTYALVDNQEERHDTYYVYDDFGNLTYVLPPKMEGSTATLAQLKTRMNDLGYQYTYDHKNRLVEKKVPGKDWEYIVYNKMDQPIMTQDALLRANGQWLFTRYDAHGRVVFTGKANGGKRTDEQDAANNAAMQWAEPAENPKILDGMSIYYNSGGYPLLDNMTQLHTIAYYDDYNEARDGMAKPLGPILGQEQAANVRGLPTATKTRVLDTPNWITTLTVYDQKGRTIWTKTSNPYLGTTDVVKTQLDFAGKPLQQQTEHTKDGNPTIATTDTFTYDHEGRLVMQEQTLDGHTETFFLNRYDGLGQLATKQVGNTLETPLQRVDYAYNIRGWMKSINNPNNLGNDLFAFRIAYNDPVHGGTPLYNGNIAETEWRTANTDNALKWYRYGYDALNRIMAAIDNTGNYDLSNVTYDKMGNILSLNRKGHIDINATTFGTMDNLMYTYDSGNKLTKVLDNGNDTYGFVDGADLAKEYAYDANGNMVVDRNKGITGIEYNHLNLPTSIDLGNGNISYIYDANGTKLEKTVSTGTTTEYSGNYIYQNDVLQFFNHPEGYISVENGNYSYVYQYKDHLGNVRLSYTDVEGDLEIVEENNYYPFGLKHKGYNSNISPNGNSVAQKWKFGGKEFDESLGLETYDFGSRHYMPDIGRWGSLDPLAEFMRNQSPFNYGFNNPIYFSDYAGTIPWPVPEMFKNWTRKIDSWFGPRGKRNHNGLDINFSGGGNTDKGAPVVATHTGRVVMVKTTTDGRAGRYIEIESPDGSFKTRYLHLSSTTVAEGDEISEGQSIGLLGGSGFGKELGYTAHLHYEIHKKDMSGNFVPYNPTEGRGNSAANIVDPQSWIPQMGPFRNAEAYNFGSSWSIFDVPFLASGQDTQSGSSDSGSSSSNGSSTTRDPISPVPVTPQPITPLPVTPPSGGTVIIPPVTPAPLPVIIPPRPPDSGF